MFTLLMAFSMNPIPQKNLATRIAISYAAISSIWLLISDHILESLITNYKQWSYVSILKGWLFVLITSILLYKFINNNQRSLNNIHQRATAIKITQFIIIFKKISEYIQIEQQLKKYTCYDPLTKLPLRPLLLEKLQHLLKSSNPETRNFAIIHLDIVHFKSVKYTLGYELSEQLLIAITDRLKTYLPDSVTIARVGVADEFIILLEQVSDEETALEILNHISNLFIEPFNLEGHELFKQIKMGLAFSSDSSGNPEKLLQAAELAVHQCRRSPNTSHTMFNPEFKAYASRRLELDNQMRRDFNELKFQLDYQPIFCAKTLKIVGFESLLHWHNNSQVVSNLEFIPLAEETGFIIPLGMWVFSQACWQFQKWRSQFPAISSMCININVSVIQLMQPNLLHQIDHILKATELPPEQVQLEITETALMNNAEYISDILKKLKSRKIQLCIDDFGTGYSSLSYLHNFPFDTLKVDKSFISGMDKDSKSLEIVRTIAIMAESLDINLVAEGVETKAQLKKLQTLKYQTVQGFLLARPMSVSAVEEYLKHNKSKFCPEAD